MRNLEIGDNVKIGNTDVIGKVTLVDHSGIHVESSDSRGNLKRNTFIVDELTLVEDEAAGVPSISTPAAALEDEEKESVVDSTASDGDESKEPVEA